MAAAVVVGPCAPKCSAVSASRLVPALLPRAASRMASSRYLIAKPCRHAHARR